MDSETQPALAELNEIQRTLVEISENLDVISASLPEDTYSLVKMQAIHSTGRSLLDLVQTFTALDAQP